MKKFKEDDLIQDWAFFWKHCFGWIEWLVEEEACQSSEWKHRYLMFLIKRLSVVQRGWG
jgi:hypothetical protein